MQSRTDARWGKDDPSGYNSQAAARSFQLTPPGPHMAVTPEAAEAIAASRFPGVLRLTSATQRKSFATVEAHPDANPDRHKEMIGPRARSIQDIPKGPFINSGGLNMPALVASGVSVSETYEGAEAIASTDSLALNAGGRKAATSIATNMRSAWPPVLKPAGITRQGVTSFAVTNRPVVSSAGSGPANGKIVLAQADSAVAMAETQRPDSNVDSWQSLPETFHKPKTRKWPTDP